MANANKKCQRGRGLLEALVVLALIMAVLPILYRKMVTRMEETENVIIAAQMRAVSDAVRRYIEEHYGILTSTSDVAEHRTLPSAGGSERLELAKFPLPGQGDTIIIPMGKLSNFLPMGMYDPARARIRMRGRLFEDYEIAIRRERREIGVAAQRASQGMGENHEILDSKVVSGIIFTRKPERLQHVDTSMRAAQITGLLGFNAGVVRDHPLLTTGGPIGDILGNQGAWSMDIRNVFEGARTFDNRPRFPEHGNVALVVYKGLADQLNRNVLYRQHIPGFPDANKMMTRIDMAGNNIVNIDEADARHILVMHERGGPVAMEFFSRRNATGDTGGIIQLFDIGGNPDNATITIDGATGEIRFTRYQEPFSTTFSPGEATAFSEGALVVGRTPLGHDIPHVLDDDGNIVPMFGMRPDQTSIMRDVRIRAAGGQLLSELMPRLSLMSIQRNVREADIIPAPGFVHHGGNDWRRARRQSDGQLRPTCPAGFVPAISLRQSGSGCPTRFPNIIPDLSDTAKRREWFETLRCFWPHPDYLPLTTYQANIHTGSSQISPAQLRIPAFAIGFGTANNNALSGSFISPISGGGGAETTPQPATRFQFVRTPHPGVHDETVLNSVTRAHFLERLGFSRVYNTIRCSILDVVIGVAGATESGASGYCQGDALYLRFAEGNIGNRTLLRQRAPDSPVNTGTTNSNFIAFETCSAAEVSVLQQGDSTPFRGLERVFASSDCPMERGWALLSKTPRCDPSPCAANSAITYDQPPFLFIRVPVAQFAQIGRDSDNHTYRVGGATGGDFIIRTQTIDRMPNQITDGGDLPAGTEVTVGWELVEVRGGQGVDAYIYCRYVEGSFNP
ncbi:MAG: shufflon system plasmid conjugative transfer pilus tip adhesin PilV [Alphaproteobacteria bacterium]|nr:shufflon system plasmid conjugative transfer pilus tip adhesin PilV [Alphaproteobacteria bacterium]